MRRRAFIAGLGGAAAWPLVAHAQEPAKLPIVGFIGSDPDQWTDLLRAFRCGISPTRIVPNRQAPKKRAKVARVDRDAAQESSGLGIEDAYTEVDTAEIADQQVAGELTETGRRNSKAPWRREVLPANHQSCIRQKASVQIKDRYGSLPRGGIRLAGHIDETVEHLHVEWNEI